MKYDFKYFLRSEKFAELKDACWGDHDESSGSYVEVIAERNASSILFKAASMELCRLKRKALDLAFSLSAISTVKACYDPVPLQFYLRSHPLIAKVVDVAAPVVSVGLLAGAAVLAFEIFRYFYKKTSRDMSEVLIALDKKTYESQFLPDIDSAIFDLRASAAKPVGLCVSTINRCANG